MNLAPVRSYRRWLTGIAGLPLNNTVTWTFVREVEPAFLTALAGNDLS